MKIKEGNIVEYYAKVGFEFDYVLAPGLSYCYVECRSEIEAKNFTQSLWELDNEGIVGAILKKLRDFRKDSEAENLWYETRSCAAIMRVKICKPIVRYIRTENLDD